MSNPLIGAKFGSEIPKRILKQIVCALVYYSQVLRLYLFVKRHVVGHEPLVLYYHRVLRLDEEQGYDCSHRGMVVSVRTFEKQVAFLKRNYSIVNLEEISKSNDYMRNVCVITFDDGWQDNFSYAFPILETYSCPATIFVTTDFIETNEVFWQEKMIQQIGILKLQGRLTDFLDRNPLPHEISGLFYKIGEQYPTLGSPEGDRLIEEMMAADQTLRMTILGALERNANGVSPNSPSRRWMLNWTEVREMKDAGISFGSHTKSHKILTHIGVEEGKGEITESKAILERNLDTPITSFAYPNGDWSQTLKRQVQEAGYTCAVSTEKGVSFRQKEFLAMRRIGVHEMMSLGVTGRFSPSLFACSISEIFSDMNVLWQKCKMA